MSRTPVPHDAVLHLATAIEKTGTAYAFMGGLALTVWGIPRTTFDLDLALSTERGMLPSILRRLQAEDVETDEHFLKGHVDSLAGMEKVTARLLFDGSWFTIDIFLASTPFLISVMARRVRVRYQDQHVEVVTAADLILFKLIAGRRKDWLDIENIVAVQGIPDREYLERWAEPLGVTERLARVLRKD